MKILVILLMLSVPLFTSSQVSLLSIYNRTNFIDYTSSSLRYDSDIFGVRLGSSNKSSIVLNNIDVDLSLGISGRKGQDYFSDRPFYLQARGAYLGLFDLFNIYNVSLGGGFGLEYNLEGVIPGNLYGPSISWIQTIGGTVALFSRFNIDKDKELMFVFISPIAGIINRPEWTGPISKEIEELSENSYTDVLLNRGRYFTIMDYQSLTFSVVYKKVLSENVLLYVEEGLVYSSTQYPREFSKVSSKFIFGLKYRTIGF